MKTKEIIEEWQHEERFEGDKNLSVKGKQSDVV